MSSLPEFFLHISAEIIMQNKLRLKHKSFSVPPRPLQPSFDMAKTASQPALVMITNV